MLLVISCILHSHFSSMKKGAGSLDGVKFEKFFNRVLSWFNTKARRKVGRRSSSSFLFARQSRRFRNFGG